MEKNLLVELEWSNGSGQVHLKMQTKWSTPPPEVHASPSLSVASLENGVQKKASSHEKQVLSPFVGIFYGSASPGGDPYVKEGQVVKRGDSLCIIEAMKLMNVIESEYSGKILSIMVENGQPVEFEEPLFVIESKEPD